MKYLILILLSWQITIASNKWELKFSNNNIGATYGNIIQIRCLDSGMCFVLNEAKYNGGYNTYSEIMLSRDKGHTWDNLGRYNGDALDFSIGDSNTFYIIAQKGFIRKSVNQCKEFTNIKIESERSIPFRNIEMHNELGIVHSTIQLITNDGWKTHFQIQNEFCGGKFGIEEATFLNDSILLAVAIDLAKEGPPYLHKSSLIINLKNNDCKSYELGEIGSFQEMTAVNENLVFLPGINRTISGGSGHDIIYKSSDGGKSWRNVLDLYDDFKTNSNRTPFGLQSISFKDSLCGVAVGQFGKIIYTYDGGESWIYETNLPIEIREPPTMVVKYAGSTPIIGTFMGDIITMVEDNYAPKPTDIYTITGRVWEGNKGQKNIPIAMESRVTMTDSLGYYKFTQVSPGAHIIKALNKYYDGGNPSYYYKPFLYFPEQFTVNVSSDSSNFDFNAEKTSTDIQISDSPYTISFVHSSSDITITIVNPFSISDAEISLYTLQGSPCHTEHFQINTEMNTFVVPINNLEQGIYFATLKINNVIVKVEKVVIVK